MYWEYNVIICIFLKASLQDSQTLVYYLRLGYGYFLSHAFQFVGHYPIILRCVAK